MGEPRGLASAAWTHANLLDAAPGRPGADRASLERHRRKHQQLAGLALGAAATDV
jgi:hypothetical protein